MKAIIFLGLALLVSPLTASAQELTHQSRMGPTFSVSKGTGRSSMRGYSNIGVRWLLLRHPSHDQLVIQRDLLHPGEAHERFDNKVPRSDRYGGNLLYHNDKAAVDVTRTAVPAANGRGRQLRYRISKPAGHFSTAEVQSAISQFAGKLDTQTSSKLLFRSGKGRFSEGGYERGASWAYSGRRLKIKVEPKYRGERINASGTYAIHLPGTDKLVNVTAKQERGQFVFEVDLQGKQVSKGQLEQLVSKFAGRPLLAE